MWKYFGKDYKIITVMRHPVARALSNFRMNVATGVIANDADLWLDSIQGRNHALVNLRYLSGNSDITPGNETAFLPAAHKTIERMTLIGFLEEFEIFLDRFADEFGLRPKLYTYNQGKGKDISLSKEQMSRLETLCGPDIELYDAARKRFA
jgi:hypothetical protein